MQKINYKEKILLDEKIDELVLINIDDRLIQTQESDCLKISGEIKISGEVKTENRSKNFSHPIDIDIILSKDQLIDEKVELSIDDFDYVLIDNCIEINLILKIVGLKEVDAYFPTTNDQENIQVSENEHSTTRNEDDFKTINEEISEINEQCTVIQENNETKEKTLNDSIKINLDEEINITELNDLDNQIEEIQPEPINEIKHKKNSLLDQVFKNKSLKKDTSFLFHVVKKDTSYKEISAIYNIEENDLRKANNDEEIFIGKLILIPKNQ